MCSWSKLGLLGDAVLEESFLTLTRSLYNGDFSALVGESFITHLN